MENYKQDVLKNEEATIQNSGNEKNLNGLGGWLLLVGFGLIVRPFRQVWELYSVYVPIFKDGIWELFTSPSSAAYNPYVAPLISYELVVNGILVLFSLFLLYLFFTKSRRFPKLFIIFAVALLVLSIVDTYFTSFVFPDEELFDSDTVKELIRTGLYCIIWIPYMNVSKRVAATFIH